MALDTQRFFAIKTGMIIVLGALAGMATRAGHHLPGSWVEDILANGMSKLGVFCMAFTAHLVHRSLGHGGMIRTVWCMTVITGVCHLMTEFSSLMTLESGFMAGPTDVTLLALEQPLVISSVWSMAGRTPVFPVSHQVIMRR